MCLQCRYVLCNSCKSPDTLLDRDSATRIMFLRCQQVCSLVMKHSYSSEVICMAVLKHPSCLRSRVAKRGHILRVVYHCCAVWRLQDSGAHQGWIRCPDIPTYQDIGASLLAACLATRQQNLSVRSQAQL